MRTRPQRSCTNGGSWLCRRPPTLVLALAALLPWPIAAQDISHIPGDSQCPDAGWALEDEVDIGSEAEVGLRGPASAVYRTPEGGFALHVAGRVHLFDTSGTLDHSFGRPGEGPGEFGNVQVIRFPEPGVIETYDGALQRRTTFGGPPDFEVQDTQRLPFPFGFDALVGPDGRAVVNRNLRTPESAGSPLHLVDRDGTLLRSFGKDPPELRPGVAFPLSRQLAWAGREHEEVWSAHRREYRVERWNLEGEMRGGFVREVPWFEPWEMDGPVTPEAPPPPRIAAVHAFDRDAVGVLLMLPAADPSEGLEQEGDVWVPTRIDRVVRGRLEIVAPRSGCVRAAFDVEGYPLRFLEDGAVAIYDEEGAGGLPRIRILAVRRGG